MKVPCLWTKASQDNDNHGYSTYEYFGIFQTSSGYLAFNDNCKEFRYRLPLQRRAQKPVILVVRWRLSCWGRSSFVRVSLGFVSLARIFVVGIMILLCLLLTTEYCEEERDDTTLSILRKCNCLVFPNSWIGAHNLPVTHVHIWSMGLK